MNNFYTKNPEWINGQIIKLSEVKISFLDWGFLRFDATYNEVHVWKGRFF